MASDLPRSATSQAGSDSPTFTLHILSPSVGVQGKFTLKELPEDLTVKQLKERIRNVVAAKPVDQAQRLIHRGRLLARDSETMTEVFGQEAVCDVLLNQIVCASV